MWRPSGTRRDAGARAVLGLAAQPRAAQADLAGGERDEPHDRVQRRRFAGAVGADQPDDLAPSECQAEVANGGDAAVADLDAVELEDGFAGHSAPR